MNRWVLHMLRADVRHLLTAAIILTSSAIPAAAGTVTLTWNPNPEPDIAGYIVFYGTGSGQYDTSVDVGNQTAFEFVEPDHADRYYFAVRAYNEAGLQSEFSPEVSTTADAVAPLALTGVTSNLPSPQVLGASVTFAAATTGGVGPVQYKWLVFDGSAWKTGQSWTASNTFTWTPAVANANYQVKVWARSATSMLDAPENPSSSSSFGFPIVPALALTSLTASLPSPQLVGTSITLTASASGGIAPYQFKWLISNGTAWSIARDWSTSNAFVWTPTVANASYSLGVWVRSANNTIDATENSNAGSSIPFAITAGSVVTVTSLTANKSAPQLSGTKIQFTANATGANALQYKWWLFDGVTWVIAQEWSSSNRFSWTPGAANADYQVLVRAKNPSNPLQSAGVSMPFPITDGNGNGRRR